MKTNKNRVLTRITLLAIGIFFLSVPIKVSAENPLTQTFYGPDPAPLVVTDENGEETFYLYSGHDEQKILNRSDDFGGGPTMRDWRLLSSKDMVNWTDHGAVLSAVGFNGNNHYRAWASQCVMRPIKQEDGTWKDQYFFFACFSGTKIDVAVADYPWGPYTDATPGTFLIDGGWAAGNIDPTVLIDDNGFPDDPGEWDAYLYWGNPYLRYCKLTDDMIDVDPDTDGDGVLSDWENSRDSRFSQEDNRILGTVKPGLHSFQTFGDEGYEAFGIPTSGQGTTGKFPQEPTGSEKPRSAFEEGPWVWKHVDDNPDTDDYFIVFAGGRTHGETIEYSSAPTPLGPWTWRAVLMERSHGFSSNHPGVETLGGRHYLAYHTEMLMGGNSNNRSASLIEFEYDENNLIKRQTPEATRALLDMGIVNTAKGTPFFSVEPVNTLNPYALNQAETICWQSNLDGSAGGYRGTGRGVRTKPKEQHTEIDPVTGRAASWQSAALYGTVVTHIHNNDYIKIDHVDFGERGASDFTASVACAMDSDTTLGGEIELWLNYNDSNKREQIGTLYVDSTGGDDVYKEMTTPLTRNVTGIHELFFVFKGEEIPVEPDYSKQNYSNDEDPLLTNGLFQFDTWYFTETVVKVNSITLNAEKKSLKPGENFTVETTVLPESATDRTLLFTSSNETVASVNGIVITAKSPGSAIITATARDGSGIQAFLTITVEQQDIPAVTEQPVKLQAPKSLKAVQASATQMQLTWSSVSNAKQYTIYRSTKRTSGFVKLNNVTVNRYIDKQVKAGKTYYYYVKASRTLGADDSLPSATVKASIMRVPFISLKAIAGNKVRVSWKRISGVSGYEVLVSNKKSGVFKKAATITKAKQVKANIRLNRGKRYFIRVRAYKIINKKKVYGAYSKVRNIKR